MSARGVVVLMEQLVASLRDWKAGEVEVGPELAGLAGLLERRGEPAALLDEVRAEVGLRGALEHVDVEGVVNRLVALEEGEEPEVVDDVLFALDEIGAAARFLDVAGSVAGAFDEVTRVIHAFPEPFAGRSELASALLRVAPPLAGDPAGPMWLAVEVASVARVGGLRLVVTERPVSLAEVVGEQKMAAAELPEAVWRRVAEGEGWEVAITARAGRPLLVIAPMVGIEPRVFCGDEDVQAVRGASGLWEVAVEPGRHRVEMGEVAVELEVVA